LSFDVSGPFANTGFASTVSAQVFNDGFAHYRSGPLNSLYTNAYNDIVAALNDPRFSRIGREGSADERKREIAAFMAHVVKESGALQYAEEIGGTTDANKIYCRSPDPLYPCAAGKKYFGRGAHQLSWNYNYGQASEYFGMGTSLLTNPDQVAQNGPLSWRTSMFFWLAWLDKDTNALLVGPHYRFLHDGFGGTMRAINGALECGTASATEREGYYQYFCSRLGVGGCDQQLACPPM